MAEKPTHYVTPGASQQGISARLPGDIAREAIPLLEKAIFDEFGLSVKMGAELEFCAVKGRKALKLKKTFDSTPSNKRPQHDQIPLFENSPIVSGFYKEIPMFETDKVKQYEIVFSHQHPGEDLRYLGDAITRIKATLQSANSPYDPDFNPEPKPTPNLKLKNYFSRIHLQDFVPTFSSHPITGVPKPVGIENGLHLNFSLWDKEGNILERFPTGADINQRSHNAFEHTLRNETWNIFQPCLACIAPSLDVYRRHSENKLNIDEIRFRTKDEETPQSPSQRCENRIAGVEADPYVAIMMNLAGIYNGLKKMKYEQRKTDYPQPEKITDEPFATRFEAEVVFMYKNPLKPLLNSLQPNLGDAFHDAVLAQVRRDSPPRPL